ncbi:MAG: hypothetical protein JSU73_09325 [candidate division WOR-3 bacterium]|nr:MAG: hypothetical protein JSU73_09325 [candidate division WOR-3 bacterium]
MRSIKVSARDIVFAMSNRVPDTNHYLDTETGDVLPVFGFNRDAILAMVREQPDRYVRLAPQSGRRGFEVMQQFAATVSRKGFRQKLKQTLEGKHSFRRFREVLHEDPDEYRRWKLFRLENMAQPLREKLKKKDIKLELIDTDYQLPDPDSKESDS